MRAGGRGSALVAVLVLVGATLLVTTIVTVRATLVSERIVRAERQLVALNAAEAGLAEALQRLRWDPWLSSASGRTSRAEWDVELRHEIVGVELHLVTLGAAARAEDQSRSLELIVRVRESLAIDRPAAIEVLEWSVRR